MRAPAEATRRVAKLTAQLQAAGDGSYRGHLDACAPGIAFARMRVAKAGLLRLVIRLWKEQVQRGRLGDGGGGGGGDGTKPLRRSARRGGTSRGRRSGMHARPTALEWVTTGKRPSVCLGG